MAENGTNVFQQTEIDFTRLSAVVIKLAYASYIVYIVQPGATQAYAVVTGSVTNDTFVGTFNDV